jgi:hypothetical protein
VEREVRYPVARGPCTSSSPFSSSNDRYAHRHLDEAPLGSLTPYVLAEPADAVVGHLGARLELEDEPLSINGALRCHRHVLRVLQAVHDARHWVLGDDAHADGVLSRGRATLRGHDLALESFVSLAEGVVEGNEEGLVDTIRLHWVQADLQILEHVEESLSVHKLDRINAIADRLLP